jgi:hypothetical protein
MACMRHKVTAVMIRNPSDWNRKFYTEPWGRKRRDRVVSGSCLEAKSWVPTGEGTWLI